MDTNKNAALDPDVVVKDDGVDDAVDANGDVDNHDSQAPAQVIVTVSHRKASFDLVFHEDSTISDLFDEIEATFDIPKANQKVIVPKGPLLKYPPKDPQQAITSVAGKKLLLMGSGTAEIEAVRNMCAKVAKRNAARMAQWANRRQPAHQRQSTTVETKYTFLQVRPLQGLPRPERSQALLMRLKADPGIVASMRKHKFAVSLLTEMEPLAHTQSTHEGTSRILGLNRNHGEVIELRLRTDAHDGYRDYKTIRKTLCHELAHNVHGDHDRHFWDLCHQIEREVEAADWKSGGHTIGESSRYHLSGQDDAAATDEYHEDDGGWTGGEFVLGGVKSASAGMSRREILAQAAMERQRKDDESEQKAEKGWRPCQRFPKGD